MAFPTPTNFTNIGDIFIYVNGIGDGWTTTIFLVVMHVVFLSFMVRRGNEFFDSLMGSTYPIIVVVGFLFAFQAIPTDVVIFYSILGGAIFLVYLAKRE